MEVPHRRSNSSLLLVIGICLLIVSSEVLAMAENHLDESDTDAYDTPGTPDKPEYEVR